MVVHTIGWPMDARTYGGSWLYHVGEQPGLDRLRRRARLREPAICRRSRRSSASRPIRRSARSSRAAGASPTARGRCREGGFQSIPKLVFPGGCLIGDTAGFLNVPKIKGTHTAMKSGMVCRRGGVRRRSTADAEEPELTAYPERLKQSWLWDELYRVRNIRPVVPLGPVAGTRLLGARHLRAARQGALDAPRTTPTTTTLKKASEARRSSTRKPDGKLTFDRLSSVFLSNTNHEEDQPAHLTLKDPTDPDAVNLPDYDGARAALLPGRRLRVSWRRRRRRNRGCRSTRRTASTARPATSRTRPRTSTGSCPRAAAGRTIRTCEKLFVYARRSWLDPAGETGRD